MALVVIIRTLHKGNIGGKSWRSQCDTARFHYSLIEKEAVIYVITESFNGGTYQNRSVPHAVFKAFHSRVT